MHFWTREHLKSEKGNALLMALAIIMVLTAFGTASLMTSVANIQMSSKYRNWSKEYYVLDKNAEAKVDQLNTILQIAESNAQAYMAGQHYIYTNTDPVPLDLRLPSYAQSYINSQWLSDVAPYMEDMSNTVYQTKLKNFMEDTVQRLYYYYASQQIISGGYNSNSVTYLKSAAASIGNYQRELFNTLALDNGTSKRVLEEGNFVVDISSAVPINPVAPNDTIKTINAIAPDSINGKLVSVKVDVRFPTYEVKTQTKFIPLQGNPVWANAITAGGNVGFVGSGATPKIIGDIFAADRSEDLPINDNVVTNNGVYSQGANLTVRGNVYSKGNLHIIGSNSTINVENYPSTMEVTLKNKIFSDNGTYSNLFFDLAAAGSISGGTVTDYIQGYIPSGRTYIPMVYQDAAGGNVYCNSLVVEGHYPGQKDQAILNGAISVDGNVTTYNDIRMDGLSSKIIVAQNSIGVNSTADATGNPNASSSIINNTPLKPAGSTESTITLKGKFITPGTAFAKYNGSKKAGEPIFTWNDNIYYQTGESISASNTDIFSAYMAAVSNPLDGYNYFYDQYTENPKPDPYDETLIHSYYFMRGEAQGSPGSDILEPKITQLVDFLKDKKVVSNILLSSSVDGYSPGTALMHQADPVEANKYAPYLTVFDPYDAFENYMVNQSAYGVFKNNLASIFKAKTQQLGTTEELDPDDIFEGVFVDKSALDTGRGINSSPTNTPDSFVFSKEATTTLNLADGNKSGIIYCEGDLRITGNGTFNGSIICEGNVTVTGSPTITYDENVIKKTLQSYTSIRNFFKPGNMGEITYSSYTAPAYDGAVRKDVIRYKILEWKEQHQ